LVLDPRRLLTFHAVARAGSFSAAARELSLTQPAVSQQVAALERELGAQLLHRGPGGLTLTDAGALALEHAEALAERLAIADAQLGELGNEEQKLRVGAFPSALATIVPAAIERLVPLHVEAVEGTMEVLPGRVADGSLHVAICFQDADDPPREHPGLRRHDLLVEPFVAIVGAGHRLAGRKTIRIAELEHEPWTAPSLSGILARACRAAGFEPDVRFLSADVLAIRAVVAAGLAVSLTPQLIAGHLDGVHSIEVRDDPPRRAVYALTPRTGTTAAARAFLDAISATPRSRGSRPARAPTR
jgi:DNA-binding transcriptional LysR family regulator